MLIAQAASEWSHSIIPPPGWGLDVTSILVFLPATEDNWKPSVGVAHSFLQQCPGTRALAIVRGHRVAASSIAFLRRSQS